MQINANEYEAHKYLLIFNMENLDESLSAL